MANTKRIGALTTLLGGVLEIGSDIYTGYLQNKIYKANASLSQAQGNYSSAVEEFNAAVSRANAEAIRASADLDIERQEKARRKFTSGQLSKYAASGVKIEGSPLLVMIESAQEAKLDIAITDYNAKIGIMRAETQAKGHEVSGELAKSIGKATSVFERSAGKYQRAQRIAKGTTSLLEKVSSYSR